MNPLKSLLILLAVSFITMTSAQETKVGIGTTAPEAVLDINSASSGILMPRVTTAERLAITNPQQALTVYDKDLGCFAYWHNNQWQFLCGRNIDIDPSDDIDDDDDGIKDTDESICTSEGAAVTFMVDAASVPANPVGDTRTQYVTITGTYSTPCGTGTWSFEKPEGGNNFSYFNNNIEDGDDPNTPTVGTVDNNNQVYFNFSWGGSKTYTLIGKFNFNGPAVKPIFVGNNGLNQNFGVALDKITLSWTGDSGMMYDPDNQTNKNNGATIASGSQFQVYGKPNNNTLNWKVTLGQTNEFSISTDKSGLRDEGFALRALTAIVNDSDDDGDGINASLDIDSDNDGIYDLEESGYGAYDTNNDGVLDYNDTGYSDNNQNGMFDHLENKTPADADGDGIFNAYELDADNDDCYDVYEAGFTDANENGILDGTGFNTNGAVSGSNGYTNPGLVYLNPDYCLYNPQMKAVGLNGNGHFLVLQDAEFSTFKYNLKDAWTIGIIFNPLAINSTKWIYSSSNSDSKLKMGIRYESGNLIYEVSKKMRLGNDEKIYHARWSTSNLEQQSWNSLIITYNGSQTKEGFKFYRINLDSSSSDKGKTVLASDFVFDTANSKEIILQQNENFDESSPPRVGDGFLDNKYNGKIAFLGISSKEITNTQEISTFCLNSVKWINDRDGETISKFGDNSSYVFDKGTLNFNNFSGKSSDATWQNNKIWLFGDYGTYKDDETDKTFLNLLNYDISPSLWDQNGGVSDVTIFN